MQARTRDAGSKQWGLGVAIGGVTCCRVPVCEKQFEGPWLQHELRDASREAARAAVPKPQSFGRPW